MKIEKILIIGAGLSGLYTAYLLQEHYDIQIVEARQNIGGRVMSVEGHDLGPSWVWGHQKNILSLVSSLGLELMEQYTEGLALYDSPEGVQRFHSPPSVPSARIKGGVSSIIHALAEKLDVALSLDDKVLSVTQKGSLLHVESSKGSFDVDRVISTLPPRLASESITFTPVLPEKIKADLQNIPTWMGYSAKCVIVFDSAFWKEEGLSGFAFSHLGPLVEIHDACTESTAALFGFLHAQANMENIEEKVKAQLMRLYGPKAADPENIYLVDWKKEVYTSTRLDALPLREHPNYGFDVTHFDKRFIFSGTESAFQEGGYLEGAVNAAKEVAAKLS